MKPIVASGAAKRTIYCGEMPKQSLEWAERYSTMLLGIAWDRLTLGRASLYRALVCKSQGANLQPQIKVAGDHLIAAVDAIRRAGQMDELPRGLIPRAWLRWLEGDETGGRRDLDEAWEIAERGPMRLHMADIQFTHARLFRDRQALAQTRQIVEQYGYWRRKEELEDAEEVAKRSEEWS
jgi:hypothetical protein